VLKYSCCRQLLEIDGKMMGRVFVSDTLIEISRLPTRNSPLLGRMRPVVEHRCNNQFLLLYFELPSDLDRHS
jgi:hypothetical protein